MSHANPPMICDTCHANIVMLAENMNASPIVSFCDHKHSPQVTLVICHQIGGVVRSWNLQGPMPIADAQRYAARVAALAPQRLETASAN